MSRYWKIAERNSRYRMRSWRRYEKAVSERSKFACQHYWHDSCPHYEDVCECEQGREPLLPPCNEWRAVAFEDYVEGIAYEEDEEEI